MPKKGENIFRRKDGRWEARYIKSRDRSGKAIYGFCYGKTYTEAREKVTLLKAQVMQGRDVSPAKCREKFSWYCSRWLEQRRKMLKPSTYAKYESILRIHILPALGNCNPSQFSSELIERFRADLICEKKLAPKTVRDILMILKMAVDFTQKQVPGVMPGIEIPYPREQKREMRVLTLREQDILVEYLTSDMDNCRFGVYLAFTTGLRIGELCALRWENFSIQNRTITVASTMQRLKNYEDGGSKTCINIGSPKSDTSSRTIPLTDHTIELSEPFRPEQPAKFVLTGTENYMEPRTLQYRFQHYMEECGLEDVHFHTLRHTFATRCVEVGFEIKSLSEILGHANTSITLNRYVHSSLELKRQNISKLSTVGF